MRIVLFAYGSLGSAVFRALENFDRERLSGPFRIVGVYTHLDAEGERLWFDSVAERARSLGVPVEMVEPYQRYRPPTQRIPYAELIISAGFRSPIAAMIFRKTSLGAYNLHPSLLPRYRGRSPLNWAILNGESEVGLTLHHMVEEVDAGPIVAQRALPIGADEPVSSVVARVDREIEPLLREAWPLLVEGRAPAVDQDHSRAHYFGGRSPEDGRLDFAWPARRLHNLVRAVSEPFPGAFFEREGRRITVWEARVVDEVSPGPGLGVSRASERFLIGTSDGLLEVLRWSLDDGPARPGGALEALW